MEVKLVVVGGKNAGVEIPVPGAEFVVGRAEGCNLRAQSDRVSRKHCLIHVEEGRASVRDLGSSNGTYVNDERVTEERDLKNGDRLKIGPLEFDVQLAVSVGGKKKPKVQSVQEAAARTVQSAGPKNDDDVDVSDWIEDTSAPVPGSSYNEVLAAKLAKRQAADTVQIPPPASPGLLGGGGEEPAKPTAATSRDAAADILKRMMKGG